MSIRGFDAFRSAAIGEEAARTAAWAIAKRSRGSEPNRLGAGLAKLATDLGRSNG